MIRADLVYRLDPESESSPLSEDKRVNFDSLRHLEEDEVPLLECRLLSSSPVIRTAQMAPFQYRFRCFCVLLEGGPAFPLTCLGTYALNLAALEPFPGEELLLSRPRVYKRRGKRKKEEDSPYEVFLGGPDNDPDHFPSRIELRTPPGSRRPLDKRGTLDDIMFNPSTCKKDYTRLQDLRLDNRDYNVWGVVTKVKRDPSPTSRQFILAVVYMIDENYQGSFGFPDFQFSILSKDINDFLPLRPGSIIRVHSLRTRDWSGELTGCVFDAKLITLVKWNDKGLPELIYKSKNFVWTEDDKKRAKELHLWWMETLQPKERENILSHALEIQAVKGYCRFDLYCVVMNKFMIDEDDFVLNVSDGTMSPILSESFVIEDNSFSFRPREGKYEVDIFFTGQQGLYHSLTVGDCILLTQILCHVEKEVDNRTIYKFSVDRIAHSNCKKMEFSHPVTMDIKRKIDSLPGKDVDMDELDSEYFSQRSVKAGHRLDNLKLRSQKSYVETMSTTSTFYADKSVSNNKKTHDEDDILSSSSSSSTNESELFHCLKSVFTSVEEDSDELKTVTEIPDIPRLISNKNYGHFYTRGLIKAVHPRNPIQMVITICSRCDLVAPIQNLEVDPNCPKCRDKRLISFNFQMVLQKDLDFIDVFVSGCNAELFLGITAADFLEDRRAQGEIFNKFRHFIINQVVELNVAFSKSKGLCEFYSMGKPRFLGNV